ncbi:hypothetical protein P3X46_033589 [Hevea brasiliensis]|uniref:Reverse transcriptase zinc-binding domain-containing protein n=1 Tax=Hevea brasiliensis TaxID=3981 RepID=A0ABQ9KEP5_HEVBR|nr:hypothetical protein P3X46_033589 [Hevea brasiliensis]
MSYTNMGLSTLFDRAERRGDVHGSRVSRNSPRASHLFFADDRFFFFKVLSVEASNVRNILTLYEHASGQAINFQKSCIFFKCLWKRVAGWKGKFLSRVGKEIFLKSIAQAIPFYYMSVFYIPVSTCDELEHMMNSFYTLLGRILKAKYFSSDDFLHAQEGFNPSFVWKSLLHAQDVLKRGIRWRVGDGRSHWSKKGIYIVKSAYHLLMGSNRFLPSTLLNFEWKKLWKAKGVDLSIICPSCSDPEDADHALLHCPIALDCWAGQGVNSASLSYVSFALDTLQPGDVALIARSFMLFWALWSKRNYLFGKSIIILLQIENKILVGSIVWDEQAQFKAAFSSFQDGVFEPHVAKALALHETLRWLLSYYPHHVIIETDCKMVYDSFCFHDVDMFEFGQLSLSWVK